MMDASAHDVLVALAIRDDGDWDAIHNDIKARETLPDDSISAAREVPEDAAVTMIDDGYPERLKKMMRPPFVLFRTKGSGPLPTGRAAYLINQATDVDDPYPDVAETTVRCHLVTNGWTIVRTDHATIRVEYPDGTVSEWSIIPDGRAKTSRDAVDHLLVAAALCDLTVIVAGPKGGKASVAAASALSVGNDVYAVPHPLGSDSLCNELLANGAGFVDNDGLWCSAKGKEVS